MINPKELITDELYFANTDYFSVSLYKKYAHCEVDGLKGFGQPTESMLVGSYVDAYVSGELDKFLQDHPEIISTRGESKGKLKAPFQMAENICHFIDNDPILQQFLGGDKQTVMTGKIANIPFKIKIDSYSKGIAINDLKCMASITSRRGNYIDFITQYGYDIQLACYQEIVYQNTGEKLPCFICAVTKETPINSAIIDIPQHIMDVRLYEVQENLPRFYDVSKGLIKPIGCGHCKTCIENRKETPIISMEDIIC